MGERSFTIYTLIMSRHVLEARPGPVWSWPPPGRGNRCLLPLPPSPESMQMQAKQNMPLAVLWQRINERSKRAEEQEGEREEQLSLARRRQC